MPNSTTVTEFLLTRFSDVWELRVLHTLIFLLTYLATLLGNLLIVTVTTLDQSLHTPMYFFLRNLSFLDMCYISVTVPQACIIFLLDSTAISMVGCAAQIFLVVLFAFVELLFLTIMARDRYVAICHPLHYPVIMKHQVCVQLSLASLFSGVVYSGFHTSMTFSLPFCHSNIVHHFFCDIPVLLKLSCSDTFMNELLLFVSSIVFAGGCFSLIIMSYVRIFSTVLKFPIRERRKAFATCVPHILVVTVFVSSASAVYMKPTSNSPTIQDMIIPVFYCIVPPLLNPIIYSLRNKQIKEAIWKIMSRMFSSAK
ncbi:PREDICTED: olfactory receptor 14C36-like [Chrysochloris asiatica]|uniref:Olfactory receptor 14C36-like n=1 Tax=Chrysochloris asiatica TaxID=185453 RepID=A0A9B0U7Q8_CHRAS|nr:PREDICTED: olfactory receptor 14C36-like [Chrysochloris asiatica]